MCSFETLVDRYNLSSDPALVRLARIVHAADIDKDFNKDINTDPAGLGLPLIGTSDLKVDNAILWRVTLND